MGDTNKPKGEQHILRLVDAFIKSKVLMTAYHLDVFTVLAREPLPAGEAVQRLGLPKRSGSILLNACLALGLLDPREGRLHVSEGLAPFLVRGGDQPFRMSTYLIEYYDTLYADLTQLDEIVRTDGASSGFHLRDYFKDDVSQVDPTLAADYSAYMDATMAKIVAVVLEMYSFAGHTYLLDLCGGTGTFCEAVLRATPGLAGGVLDVPAVAQIGRARVAAGDLAGRLDVIGGDAFSAPFPAKVDVITMCRSAHDWDDERVHALVRRAFEALPAGGKLLIIERMIPDEFNPAAAALYLRAVYFLSKSRTACYRTAAQYQSMLTEAGFARTETLDPSRDPYEFFQGLRVVVGTRA